MSKLNHLNLPVASVTPLQEFFVRHFDFTALTLRGDSFAVLRGDDGFILNIMRDTANHGFPENFHIGFFYDSTDEVRARHVELTNAGVETGPVEEISRAGYKSLTFYCHAPSKILVEVGCSME